MTRQVKRPARTEGTHCVWPAGVQERYGISGPTCWRWERQGKLPARDVFQNGVAIGWRPSTLDAWDSTPNADRQADADAVRREKFAKSVAARAARQQDREEAA